MVRMRPLLNAAPAALLAVLLALPAGAEGDAIPDLLAKLADPDQPRWQRVERQLIAEWSKSGSPTADLLLQRGRAALARGDRTAAIEHLTALIDHAPEFAEGYNARAAALFQKGHYGPALDDLAMLLTLNPQHFGALIGLATILEETGNDTRALEVFRAARSIHPHQPLIHRAIARIEARVSGQDA